MLNASGEHVMHIQYDKMYNNTVELQKCLPLAKDEWWSGKKALALAEAPIYPIFFEIHKRDP